MQDIAPDLGRRRFAVGLLGLSAVWMLPAGRPAAARSGLAPELPVSRRFKVFWDKDPIGVHAIDVTPTGDRDWEVEVGIDFLIDLGLFGKVSYRYTSRESWRDGRLVKLEAVTDQDGKTCRVRGRANGRRFWLEGPDGLVDAPGDLLTSNCAWSEAICQQREIIDTASGTVVEFAATPEMLHAAAMAPGLDTARVYRVISPIVTGSFWYDADGLLMRGRLNRKGEPIEYILES